MARKSENAEGREIVVSLHNRISSVRLISTASRFRAVLEEHRELIAALRSGDPAASEEAMRRHLRAARENRDRLFDLEHAASTWLPWRGPAAEVPRAGDGLAEAGTEPGEHVEDDGFLRRVGAAGDPDQRAGGVSPPSQA